MQPNIIELARNPQIERVLFDFTRKPEALEVTESRKDEIEKIKTEINKFVPNEFQTEPLGKEIEINHKELELIKQISAISRSQEPQKVKISKLENIYKNLELHQREDFFNAGTKILN
jgi:esterase/lipase